MRRHDAHQSLCRREYADANRCLREVHRGCPETPKQPPAQTNRRASGWRRRRSMLSVSVLVPSADHPPIDLRTDLPLIRRAHLQPWPVKLKNGPRGLEERPAGWAQVTQALIEPDRLFCAIGRPGLKRSSVLRPERPNKRGGPVHMLWSTLRARLPT